MSDEKQRTRSGETISVTETTVNVELFMLAGGFRVADMKEILRDYRSETGWSPFEMGEVETLSSDFLNWFRWERL
jgi:hypothetical protein